MKGRHEAYLQKGVSRLKRSSTVGLLVAIAGLVSGLLFGILSVRPENAELSVAILATEELTNLPATPGLTAHFFYGDDEVSHVWRFRMQL